MPQPGCLQRAAPDHGWHYEGSFMMRCIQSFGSIPDKQSCCSKCSSGSRYAVHHFVLFCAWGLCFSGAVPVAVALRLTMGWQVVLPRLMKAPSFLRLGMAEESRLPHSTSQAVTTVTHEMLWRRVCSMSGHSLPYTLQQGLHCSMPLIRTRWFQVWC